MAKLPAVLKQAILEGDWQKVCVVYTTITGEPIEPSKPKTETEELANMDIPIIIPSSPAISVFNPPEDDSDEPISILPQGRVRVGGKNRKNKFVDDFTLETKDLKSRNPELAKMYTTTPTERRPPTELISINCTQCGKEVKVSPLLVIGRSVDPISQKDERPLFRCDSCSKGG